MAKKILYGIMLTIAVSSLATISACRYFSSAGTREAMMEKFAIDMKLSEGQRAQLAAITADVQAKAQEVWTPYKEILTEFRVQLESDIFDKTRIAELFARTAEPRERLFSCFLNGVQDFHATLTPEQKQMLLAKIDNMKNMRSRFCPYQQHQ